MRRTGRMSFWAVALTCALFLSPALPAQAAVHHVKADANGANDGTSWRDAFVDLQDALATAQPGDELWVAAGTYTPAPPNGLRTATFELKDAVALYGGFAGTETNRDERDPEAYEAILSGDLNGDDGASQPGCVSEPEPGGTMRRGVAAAEGDEPCTRAENSFHVVTARGVGPGTILDGFTITAGNTDDIGGGMLINPGGSSLEIINCTFVFNSANEGGGMFIHGLSSPVLRDCTFVGNVAGFGGGIGNESGEPTLIRCTFTENRADVAGGAVESFFEGSLAFIDTVFTGNRAGGDGGGFSIRDGEATLVNCRFNGNTAGATGGALSASGATLALTDCTFRGNSSRAGGGMYLFNADSSGGSGPTLKGCTFLENTASLWGGGLDWYDWYTETGADSGTLTDCTFRGNSAGEDGGGLSLDGGGTLTNCVLAGNSAGRDGGGMYNHAEAADHPAVINCTFVGNVANRRAGGMFVAAPSTRLTNCIFWDNRFPSAPGGGPRRRGDDPAAPPEAAQINGGMPLVTFSCIQGLSSFTGNGNIGTDPLFVSPGRWDDAGTPDDESDDVWVDGDYRLQPGSPCIDAGDSDARLPTSGSGVTRRRGGGDGDAGGDLPATDLDGHPRKIDDWCTADTGNGSAPIVDMGAYEFVPPPGDADCDGDVDLADFLGFAACASGPSTPAAAGCGAFDFDPDGDVDLADLVAFQSAMTDAR